MATVNMSTVNVNVDIDKVLGEDAGKYKDITRLYNDLKRDAKERGIEFTGWRAVFKINSFNYSDHTGLYKWWQRKNKKVKESYTIRETIRPKKKRNSVITHKTIIK